MPLDPDNKAEMSAINDALESARKSGEAWGRASRIPDIAEAQKMALDLAALVCELSAVVAWCLECDGECLGDNPDQLRISQRVLAKARLRFPNSDIGSCGGSADAR
jgi:hypothetical protein